MATSCCSVFSPPACHKSIANIKVHIDKILYFLDTFGWLADVYVSDFFVCDYWKKLLPCWRLCFSQMDAPEIAEILSGKQENNFRRVLPLSMLAYRQCIQSLSLKRTRANDEELSNLLATLLSGRNPQLVTMACVTSDPSKIENIEFKGGQYISLDPHYRKHVKPKKQHEIDQMSKVIGQLCQALGCDRIVDIGAGLGHLSRLLNFKYGLTVTTVEASSGHAPKAQKYDLDLKREIKKKKKKVEEALQLTQSEMVESTEFSGCQSFHLLDSSDSKMNTASTTSAATPTSDIVNSTITPTNNMSTNFTTESSSLPYHIVYQVTNTISPQEFLEILLKNNTKSDPSSDENSCKEFHSSSEVTHMDHPSDEAIFSHEGTKFFNSQTQKDLSTDTSPKISQNAELSSLKVAFSESNDKNKNNLISVGSETIHSSSDWEPSCQGKSIPSISTNKDPSDTVVLCGLHACGDLTATILQMFGQSPNVAAITSVGCCYMKLTGIGEHKQSPESIGYPMSQYLLSKKHYLSYEAREMACHFVDAYRKRLLDNCPSLKRHWYRAALQIILRAVHPDFKHGCVKLAIKNVEVLSFESYLEKALKYLGLDVNNVPADIINKCKETQDSWKDVVCFYTTRLSLAPVVETLMLLDRVLFLSELGFGCALVPIFEPMLSPRNFLLVATKPPVS